MDKGEKLLHFDKLTTLFNYKFSVTLLSQLSWVDTDCLFYSQAPQPHLLSY